MKFYFAPLEGISGYVYRNAWEQHFGPIDKYFTPFISPNQNGTFSSRELNDILPEHNEGMNIVPQILTNRAEDFIRTAKQLQEYGYEEVNLNLGCPASTVVSKKRGSGFLTETKLLEECLAEIFLKLDMKISIKTRIGKEDPEEWHQLMEIYNQFPMEELIIHPRTRADFYKNNTIHLDVFAQMLEISKNKVCYNGDIFTLEAYEVLKQRFPQVDMVMLGRGLIRNPGLLKELDGEGRISKEELRSFHDTVYQAYQRVMSGDRNTLFKMKELWCYMATLWPEGESFGKKIKKANRLSEYELAVSKWFENVPDRQ